MAESVETEADAVRAGLETYVGKPMGPGAVAPDPVNVPMIRHWVDALDDRNPVYLDEAFAASTRFGGIVAPPAMLRSVAIRLGAPAVPGKPLRFTGRVAAKRGADGECVLAVAVRAANGLGDHATGTVALSLPLG